MSDLQADESVAAYVRARARAAGVSEAAWLAEHFRSDQLRDAALDLATWYDERPGALDAEIHEAEAAGAEADAA